MQNLGAIYNVLTIQRRKGLIDTFKLPFLSIVKAFHHRLGVPKCIIKKDFTCTQLLCQSRSKWTIFAPEFRVATDLSYRVVDDRRTFLSWRSSRATEQSQRAWVRISSRVQWRDYYYRKTFNGGACGAFIDHFVQLCWWILQQFYPQNELQALVATFSDLIGWPFVCESSALVSSISENCSNLVPSCSRSYEAHLWELGFLQQRSHHRQASIRNMRGLPWAPVHTGICGRRWSNAGFTPGH